MHTLTRRRFVLAGLASLVAPVRALAARRTVRVICRSAWGARRPRRADLVPHTIERLTIHHSAVALTDNRDAPARFRGHQASHMGRGWPDIAYHVLIDGNGNVYRGRSHRYAGDTATDYDPAGHFLVMCEGSFEGQRPTGAQLRALADVLAWASERFGAGPATIRGHLDWASTSCPGRHLQAHIESGRLRRMVRGRLRRGGVRLEEICGKPGKRLVRRIERGED